jgi:hypothetical protein
MENFREKFWFVFNGTNDTIQYRFRILFREFSDVFKLSDVHFVIKYYLYVSLSNGQVFRYDNNSANSSKVYL